MIIDIFSSFDPIFYQTISSPYTIWFLAVFLLLICNTNLWLFNNSTSFIYNQVFKFIYSQSQQTTTKSLKGARHLISILFIFIITTNLSGLIPYSFSITSHLIVTFSLGLPLWTALIISSISNSPYLTTANLLPGGAPNWLNPALIIIETTSTLVRPVTLSFRLAANIRAGHIVITLIRIYLSSALLTSIPFSIILLRLNIIYIFFEIGICLIQSYIFCLLITLYANDHQ